MIHYHIDPCIATTSVQIVIVMKNIKAEATGLRHVSYILQILRFFSKN